MRRIATAAALAALVLPVAACGAGTSAAGASGKTVTVYSVDGLGDWYTKRFAEFQKQTGIKVQYVESGSGEVLTRAQKEKARPQADVLVTLPPFIQKAEKEGLLEPYTPAGADKVTDKDAGGSYTALAGNYLSFIYNPEHAKPAPVTFDDLLAPRFKKKLQYSTPGQAGDGTAVLIQLQHVLGKDKALDYLKRLEANNVGPSSSTGKLQPKVTKGELHVANGDVQMNLTSIKNDGAGFQIFFPADASGKKSTFALPYFMGLAKNAPHSAPAKKLMDFLLTPEAQKTLAPETYGLPARSDVTADDANSRQIADLMKGVQIWTPDWDKVVADLDGDVAAYTKAIGG
ncbi:2-aminoethylphosphonate ABC transporter substrate-binding protein [Actinomadura macrotermitis]|uniref:Putative 2-aminoethylphosphonate-binding periplasmic protein n=1 Tax=Actinomadura macrotermitis TaxID=2585200 RepID=A0A7K0BYQ4_9ACTN|nr:2-aminoethylphosphonate ABC transporter substrate-binding protein [Actinomadura macrotermitis]MQY06303.1 putative 2-aminoethylphosphonate-binding periplasmic protein [Actinomadura macrotermitis]